jgi:hypothetical protein
MDPEIFLSEIPNPAERERDPYQFGRHRASAWNMLLAIGISRFASRLQKKVFAIRTVSIRGD